jgi:protein SCO1
MNARRAPIPYWFGALYLSLALAASAAQPAAAAAPASNAARASSAARMQYTVPAVQLVRDDGKVVSLPDEMDDGRPVVLNFIFTTCSSICPLTSQVFAQFQQRLGADSDHVHLMSISVDPEEDTPARLREYAHKFHARPAFNVWRGDKMSHTPVTFVRFAPGNPWLRIDGFVTADELLQRYQQLRLTPEQAVAVR